MNVSLYQAAAAMNSQSKWQDMIANNLAASSIPGARRQNISFSAVQAGLPTSGSNAMSGSVMPGVKASTSFQQGIMRSTGTPTDVAIDGAGFFEVQTTDGTRGYTRDGEFHRDAQGQLVTKTGARVMAENGPLQLDAKNPSPLSISKTGEVSQGGAIKGKIRMVEFNDPNLLQMGAQGCFSANDPNLVASTAKSSSMYQGMLESSNISPTTEMTSLISSMRSFEANQKVIQSQDERMGRVISDLGTPS